MDTVSEDRERKIDVERQSVRVGGKKGDEGEGEEEKIVTERNLSRQCFRLVSYAFYCSAFGLGRYRVKIATRFHFRTTIIATNRCLPGESLLVTFFQLKSFLLDGSRVKCKIGNYRRTR